MQSRRLSAVEAVTSVVVGYAVAWALTYTVLPFFGYQPSVADTTSISAIFTVASLIRSYLVRRMFARIA